jgi:hypothetical protein
MLATTGEPHILSEGLHDENWHEARKEEYNAFLENKPGILFLLGITKILLIAIGYII